MALASTEILAAALKECGDLTGVLVRHDARLRQIIEQLEARSCKTAAIFIPQSLFAFRLRNFVLRYMPRAWLGRISVAPSGRKLIGAHAIELNKFQLCRF